MAAILAEQRLHQLFELWDVEGKGHLGFADVALGLRRLCTTAQKLPSTAADAAEVWARPLAAMQTPLPAWLFSPCSASCTALTACRVSRPVPAHTQVPCRQHLGGARWSMGWAAQTTALQNTRCHGTWRSAQ